MAAAIVASLSVASGTSLRGEVVFAGPDVASSPFGPNMQLHTLIVTGIDFANGSNNVMESKIGAAVRAMTPALANSSGGAGFTVPVNQCSVHPWAKV